MSNDYNDEYSYITPANVDDELKKYRLFDGYDSDEYEHDRICLTSSGIDLHALKAGQNVEFSVDTEETKYDIDDEKIDYEKIFKYRNMEMLGGVDDGVDETTPNDSKTPFEILKAKMEDITEEKNEGVMKRVLTPGYGLSIPNGSHVRIHYNAYFEMNDEPFDSTYLRNKSFQFKLGANEVVIGLDVGVATMKRKEKSQFIFKPEYYCGKYGCEPRVPRETPVLFEIEVISALELGPLDEFRVSSEEERRSIPFKKILQICSCLRELGNDNFARQNYREASHNYRKAIYIMENKSTVNEEEDTKHKSISLKLYLNMSQVSLKQTKPKKCIYYCKLALAFDPENIKAIFRYGKALRLLQDFDRSRKYLMKALHLQPTNKEIIEEVKKLDHMVLQYNALEKNMYKRMFNGSSQTSNSTLSINIDNNNNERIVNNTVELSNFKPNNNTLNEETKAYIRDKLKEFLNNPTSFVYKIQADYYPEPMLNYVNKEAELLGLKIRYIKGNTNVLQIMKEKQQ